MLPFYRHEFPGFMISSDCPFDPELPYGPPSDDEVPDDNPLIPHPSTSDRRIDTVRAVTTWSKPLPTIRMLQTAYLDIIRHLESVPPEAGGMLLGPKGSSVVTHYIIDLNGKATAYSFTLDALGLNHVLKKSLECGLDCKGLVHSHPAGCTRPSSGDLAYVQRSFANEKNKDLTEFLLPIFCGGILIPYVVRPHESYVVQFAQLILF